jgi:hypothetical protein
MSRSLLQEVALVMVASTSLAAEAAVMLSVKVVKTEAGRCSAAPRLEFVSEGDVWRVVDQPCHNGENDWEVFFEIETEADKPALAEIAVVAPGARAGRVIVGKTDVPFEQTGDRVRFRSVDDRSRGQLMQVRYQDPRGGYPIDFIHNWEMRRAGPYAKGPFPAKQIAAVKNYLLAAREVLRMMGNLGPEQPKGFRGDLVLMDSEIAATRGHLDYPSHLHLMFYQFGKNAEGKQDWVGRLVPHFYMDDEGRIVRNSYAVLAGPGKSGELGKGAVCRFEDTVGNHVLDLIVADEGLLLRRPDGDTYSLRPDPEDGAARAVFGYHGDEPICRAEAHDDPAKGVFAFQIDTLRDGKVVATFEGGYRYDPFTAKALGK